MSKITYHELIKVSQTLHTLLHHAKIQKIRDPDPYTLSFKVRVPGQTYYLIISAHPDYPRITLSTQQPTTLPEPTGLGRWARAHLNNTRITQFSVAEQDRILFMHTTGGILCLELIPKVTNLYALNHDFVIQAWIEKKTARHVELAHTWVPIKNPPKITLIDATTENVLEQVSSHVDQLIEQETNAQSQILQIQQQKEQREIRTILKDTHKRLSRLSEGLWTDMEKADQAEQWKKYGELLKSHVHTLERGMTEIEVTDWYDEQMPQVQIILNPKLNGLENMEHYFKKHRKAIKGAELAAQKLETVERNLMEIEHLQAEQDQYTLLEVRQQLQLIGVFRAKQQLHTRKRKQKRQPYRIFWSKQGEEIWLGRGGQDNHDTTFRHARGRDHWLHTRDVPGAHVIIPIKSRGSIPHFESIQDAAALAVHHSKLRGEEGVHVYHTERKHIRPVPQGPAGKVMVASSQTVIPYEVNMRVERLYNEVARREAIQKQNKR